MDNYKTRRKDRMGLQVPAVIESLPAYVQDNLIQAEILLTMWSRYTISGYERVVQYKVMTIFRRHLVSVSTCHDTTPGHLEKMYPSKINEQHREWIEEVLHVSSDARNAIDMKAYLFLCKDMGIGGNVSKYTKMNSPSSRGYVAYALPEPVSTWYDTFFCEYDNYVDLAGTDADAEMAAEMAAPGSLAKVGFVAALLQEAQERADEAGLSIQDSWAIRPSVIPPRGSRSSCT